MTTTCNTALVRAAPASHMTIDPAILYFGTPVALLTTLNPDGTDNIMPMSSVFWLGKTALLGLGTRSQTASNLMRERQLVINLPSAAQVDVVDRLALTTGRDPVPGVKAAVGYTHVADKFAHAGLTRAASQTVSAPRILECPVQLEAEVVDIYPLADSDPAEAGGCRCCRGAHYGCSRGPRRSNGGI